MQYCFQSNYLYELTYTLTNALVPLADASSVCPRRCVNNVIFYIGLKSEVRAKKTGNVIMLKSNYKTFYRFLFIAQFHKKIRYQIVCALKIDSFVFVYEFLFQGVIYLEGNAELLFIIRSIQCSRSVMKWNMIKEILRYTQSIKTAWYWIHCEWYQIRPTNFWKHSYEDR